MTQRKLDSIIMGTKEFHFKGEHYSIEVPKSIAMVYDLKKMLGEKYNLINGLNKVMRNSQMRSFLLHPKFF